MLNNNVESDQIIFTVTKDKALTYVLVALIVATVVFGYSVVSNKNRTVAKNPASDPMHAQEGADDMASHHGGGGNKQFIPLAPGTVAPDFNSPSTSGKTISLADYRGKNVLLFFNEGVMCSPCWQEISRLERFKTDFENLNTIVIPISVDDQKTWDPILKEEKITTSIVMDLDRKISEVFKALKTPSSMHDDRPGHTYIHVDPQGKIHASSDFPNMNVPTNVLLQHIQQYINGNLQG